MENQQDRYLDFSEDEDEERKRYFDFSEDEELLRQFDPSGVAGRYLSEHAELISNYLGYYNPLNRIAGLLAHLSAVSASIHRVLARIMWLMVANTVLIGYIVYKFA